jgi:hypothetical protein
MTPQGVTRGVTQLTRVTPRGHAVVTLGTHAGVTRLTFSGGFGVSPFRGRETPPRGHALFLPALAFRGASGFEGAAAVFSRTCGPRRERPNWKRR